MITDLQLASLNHLLPEVGLVIGDGAWPSSDALVLTDENFLGNLVKKPIVTSLVYCSELGSGKNNHT